MIAYAVVLRPEEDTPDPKSTGLKKYLVLISIFQMNKKFPVCFDFQSVIFDCLQVYNNPCQNVLNYKNLIKKRTYYT